MWLGVTLTVASKFHILYCAYEPYLWREMSGEQIHVCTFPCGAACGVALAVGGVAVKLDVAVCGHTWKVGFRVS